MYFAFYLTFHKINRTSNAYRWQNLNWSKNEASKIPTLMFTFGLFNLPQALNPYEFISNLNI